MDGAVAMRDVPHMTLATSAVAITGPTPENAASDLRKGEVAVGPDRGRDALVAGFGVDVAMILGNGDNSRSFGGCRLLSAASQCGLEAG